MAPALLLLILTHAAAPPAAGRLGPPGPEAPAAEAGAGAADRGPEVFTPRVTNLDPALTSMAQFVVGAAFTGLTPSVLWLLSTVLGPVCPPCAVLGGLGGCTFFCFGPVLAVFLEAVVGDTLGGQRGAMLWPIVIAYGAGCGVLGLQAIVIAVVGAVLGVAAIEPLVEGRFEDVEPTLTRSLAAGEPFLQTGIIIAAIVTPLVVAAAPAFAWSAFAEPKRAGDLGQPAWPGLLSPQHPAPLAEPAIAY